VARGEIERVCGERVRHGRELDVDADPDSAQSTATGVR